MSTPPASETTRLLTQARQGDAGSADVLFGRLYGELRRLAHARLSGQPETASLNTTGLVHEAYLRLVEPGRVAPADRAHFLALATRAMRYVVLDRARARQRLKRGGVASPSTLHADLVAADARADDLLALDEALDRLQVRSPRLAETVAFRFYGGLGYAEVAEVTGRSVATVERDWVRARLWLYRDLRAAGDGSASALPPDAA